MEVPLFVSPLVPLADSMCLTLTVECVQCHVQTHVEALRNAFPFAQWMPYLPHGWHLINFHPICPAHETVALGYAPAPCGDDPWQNSR